MHAYMYFVLQGASKVVPISRKEKGSRNLTDGAQGQSEYSIYSVCPLLFHDFICFACIYSTWYSKWSWSCNNNLKGSRTTARDYHEEVNFIQVTLKVLYTQVNDPNDEVNFIQMHAYMYFVLQGASKVVPISRKEKGSRKLFYETDQEQSEYAWYLAICPLIVCVICHGFIHFALALPDMQCGLGVVSKEQTSYRHIDLVRVLRVFSLYRFDCSCYEYNEWTHMYAGVDQVYLHWI